MREYNDFFSSYTANGVDAASQCAELRMHISQYLDMCVHAQRQEGDIEEDEWIRRGGVESGLTGGGDVCMWYAGEGQEAGACCGLVSCATRLSAATKGGIAV